MIPQRSSVAAVEGLGGWFVESFINCIGQGVCIQGRVSGDRIQGPLPGLFSIEASFTYFAVHRGKIRVLLFSVSLRAKSTLFPALADLF